MDEFSSTTSLLSISDKSHIWTRYKSGSLKWISAISVLLVIVFVIIIVATSVNSKKQGNQKMEGNNQPTKPQETGLLRDILPNSFYAEFESYHLHHQKWIKDDHARYHLEWDTENKHLGYLKVVTHSSEFISQNRTLVESGIYANITVVNDEAMETVSFGGNSVMSCHTDMQADGLFYIIQLALNATFYKSNKLQRIWKYKHCNVEVDYYERNSQLVSIIQDEIMIKAVKWEIKQSETRRIKLAKLNHTCNINHPNLEKCVDNFPNRLERNGYGTRGNKEKQKDCLFIHGVGTTHRGPYKVVDSFRAYWGHIELKTTHCKSHKFIVMDTVNFGWDDIKLHDSVCNFASGKNGSIDNKVIFSHSMGNLVVAAALFRKVCKLNTKSSEWFTVQAPWTGSKEADALYKICSGHFGHNEMPTGALIHLVASKFCTSSGVPTTGYNSLKTTYTSPLGISFRDLISTAKQFSHGSMCGASATGMWRNFLWSFVFNFIQTITNLERPNDGVVSYIVCSEVGAEFGTSYLDSFYKVTANHYEGTCRFGEADWEIPGLDNEQSKPCSWYQQRL